jgi:hypothetical protein
MGFGRREGDDKPVRVTQKQKDEFKPILEDLVGTRAACILDEKGTILGRVPISEMENTIRGIENPSAIIFDGKVTGSMIYTAKSRGVKFLVGMEKEPGSSAATGICILEKKDL